ncbi:hypothetical protein F0562_033962 [Nyssa sinensis]|uniref:Uncharacterized protein n=1 Tax=Nyssa sinensis TaxID=561372 RepID=A0A5J5AG99_9ASTE|nr:hypothetical protein F0562_033962 [Nyssa sinensis]
MYVTRPRSLYKKFPSSLSTPPDGPNSGFLVLQEESKNPDCLGLFKKFNLVGLPFPQNKKLTLRHEGFEDVFFIPVLDQPLSSNRYYVIHSNGFGEAYTCSKEEDKITCCFCSCVQEVVSRPLNPYNIYQQFEIVPYGPGGLCFYAKSVAPDGYPPYVLRRKPWDVDTNTPKNYELGEAPGLDTALRARLPKFNFPQDF